MNKIRAFALETRAPFLTVTIIPVLLGTVMAAQSGGKIDRLIFTAILAGFIFLHLGTNVLNDYFDDVNGTDRINKQFIPPFSGGSRLIQSGVLTSKEVLVEAIVLFISGSLLLAAVSYFRGTYLFIILGMSLFAGVFYTAPPFKWAHRGLGEIFIFLGFGPIMVTGAYYAFTGNVSFAALALSVPVGLLASAIVDINQFPDYEADRETGKRNLVVRLGRKNGMMFYAGMVILAYSMIAAAVIMRVITVWSLLSLVGLVPSLKAIILLKDNFDKPTELAPACGMTIVSHLITGIMLIIAQIIG
ncbi:MAG: 1,4-dihydroxy-2-naphthoate octaprenyltransferase [Spirochaetia bacterium]|nr:1,4-dihydroxy-2-naphthoate octaprenyltransferase [Spirochaetia bacterium]